MILTRVLLILTLASALASAGDPWYLNFLSKDPGILAGLDVERAKGSAFGQRLLAQMQVNDPGFQKFVDATGFDFRRDLREVVLASDGKGPSSQTLLIVSGAFDQSKIDAFLLAQGAVRSYYGGVELWANPKNSGDGSVAVVNPALALFGQDAAVRDAIDHRLATATGLSPDLQARVQKWSANDAWFVSTASFADMGVNADGKNQVLPQGLSADAIRAASAGVKFTSDLQLTGEALTRSDKDAQALADVVRLLSSLIRLNANQPNAEDALKVLDTLQLTTAGATMSFSLTVPEELLGKMLNKPAAGHSARHVRISSLTVR